MASSMGILPHVVTFILVGMVAVLALVNIFYIHNAHKAPALQQLLYFVCLFQLLTMAAFTANQVGWIVHEFEKVVSLDIQLGWLAYDYQNKLFHLLAAATLNYYLRYKHTDPNEANRRRSTDD